MRPPRIEYGNLIRDALFYTSPRSGASSEMGHGAVVGVVSALMAMGMEFTSAIFRVGALLPTDARRESIPEAWRDAMPTPEREKEIDNG